MSKGAYDVSDTYVGPSKDGSFKSCICAMLIFLAICGVILVTTMLVKKSGHKELNNSDEGAGYAYEQKGGYNKYTTIKDTENNVLKPEITTITSIRKPVKAPKEFTTTERDVELLMPEEGNKQTNRSNEKLIFTTITELISTETTKTDKLDEIIENISTTEVPKTTNIPDLITDGKFDKTTFTEESETNENNNENILSTTEAIVDNNTKLFDKIEITTNQNEETTTIPPIDLITTIKFEDSTTLKNEKNETTTENFRESTTDLSTTIKIVENTTYMKKMEVATTTVKSGEDETPPTIVETEETKSTLLPRNQHHESSNIVDDCGSECRGIGARILGRMNHSVDACEQFYDYACGADNTDSIFEDNWKRIAAGLDHVNAQSPNVFKTFKNFYTSCVNFHTNYDYDMRLEDARYILSSVGQPDEAEDDGKSTLTELLTRLLLHDSSPLFDISVDVDKNTQYFIFQVNLGKHFLTSRTSKRKCIEMAKRKYEFSSSFFNHIPLNNMYNVYSECQRNELYKNETLEKAFELFGLYEYMDESVGHIRAIIEKYNTLEAKLTIRQDIITKNFQIKKVSEMNLQYSVIDWKKLFSNLVGREVGDEERVQIYFSKFLAELFSNEKFLTALQYYDALIAMFAHDLYTDFILPTSMYNPEVYCLHHSSDLMKEVASSFYLNSINFKNIEGDLKRVQDLFSKMKDKLKEMINEAKWIDVSSRLSMTNKLSNIELDTWNRSLIWKNITVIQERMKSVADISGNYSELSTALVKRNRQMMYNMWKTASFTDENVWWYILTPYSTAPVSIYALNRIFIPPGMLLTKSELMPRYISLAKLGFNLAKAVGSHFDFTGHKYKIGLSDKSNLAYEESNTCSYFTLTKETEMEFDGKNLKFQVTNSSFMRSINERFVENMAIHLLAGMSSEDVKDYQLSWVLGNRELGKDYSREKLFFIALGQEHCKKMQWDDFFLDLFENEHLPPALLLNYALSHSQLFTDVFNCKEGARMNVFYKCKAFPLYDEPEEYYDEEQI